MTSALSERLPELEKAWERLCDRFLPVRDDELVWRFSRPRAAADPAQGWKLHVSADVLSAVEILSASAPLLLECDVLFKAPRSLRDLQMLNAGLVVAFSQVGKIITVYPRTTAQAVELARRLDERTCRFRGPVVPYDLPLRRGGCVYYRYGAFTHDPELEGGAGGWIRSPEGRLVEDRRGPGDAVPPWDDDPFVASGITSPDLSERRAGPLRLIRAFDALSQRGKGGVYRALDLSVVPARLCILKEGRARGETEVDGSDGRSRVRNEARVLRTLASEGIPVPRLYAQFEIEGNSYVTMELIEGQSLHDWAARRRRGPGRVREALPLAARMATMLARIHDAGWAWRDCKPLNVLRIRSGELRPVDFEGACPAEAENLLPWGTASYLDPEAERATVIQGDLHALGASVIHLLAGAASKPGTPLRPESLGHVRAPRRVRQLVQSLMAAPSGRPSAWEAADVLEECSAPG